MKNVSKKCLSGIIVLSSVILPIQAATMPTYAESQVVMNTSSETTNLIKVEAKDATCTTDGNITYWTNSDHNKFFSDEDGKNEISQEATIVKATGHKWNEEYTVDQKATATTKGQKSIRCSVCNEIKPGSEVEFSLGWEEIEDHWYYFDEDGKKVVSQWIGDYYVDEEGIMAADTWIGNDHVNKYGLKDDTAGWKHDGKGWWYLNAGGGYPKSIWKQVDGTWYYFNDKGYMFTGWLKQGATWYYLKSNGAMAKGWDYIGNKWYYFTEDGFMKASTWIDGLYYVKADGSMAANEYVQGYWLDKNGKWSYKPRASWKKNSKGWWYEDTTGWYAKNATYVIDGKIYIFDNNGYMLDKNNVNLTVEQRLLLSNVAKMTSQIIVVYHTSGTHYYSALYNKVNGLWKNSGIGNSDTRVGKKGLNANRHSGDLTTPIGAYPLTEAFGKYNNPGTSMLYHKITNNSYWGGDTAAWGKYRNRFYEGNNPAKGGEHLNDYKQYNYALNIGFNYNPVITGKGYAIFLHCNGMGATAGCVSVPENICKSYVKNVRTGAYIIIVPSIKDISNY